MRRMLAGVVLATLASSAPAIAGPAPVLYDHLECFKMRDSISYKAVVNLEPDPDTNNPGVPVQNGCRVVVKSKEICFPAAKTVVSSAVPVTPAPGTELVNGFLCYTVKCPAVTVADFTAGDQFGVRTVGRLKATRLCVPADW